MRVDADGGVAKPLRRKLGKIFVVNTSLEGQRQQRSPGARRYLWELKRLWWLSKLCNEQRRYAAESLAVRRRKDGWNRGPMVYQ